MPISCDCGDDYEWYYNGPKEAVLDTKRRRRCISCKTLIDIGADCYRFDCYRPPRHEIEENIYGDEVPMADKHMCEACGDVFVSLTELGFCITLVEGENVRELVKEYHHDYVGTKNIRS